MEGIGYDFIPDVLDGETSSTEWIKSERRRLVPYWRGSSSARRGSWWEGSSGSAVWAALQVAQERWTRGKRKIVTILPDSVRNYMTKFVDPRWMRENRFHEEDWATGSIGDVVRSLERSEVRCVTVEDTVGVAVQTMKELGISQMPVMDGGKLSGILTESDVLSALVSGSVSLQSSVAEAMNRRVQTVRAEDPASALTEIFGREEVAIVVDEDGRVEALLSKMDLVEYLTRGETLREASER